MAGGGQYDTCRGLEHCYLKGLIHTSQVII